MSTLPGVETRVLAAKVLDAVMHDRRSLKAELANALPQLSDSRDRALLEAMCFSALRQRARYDAALKSWMQKPLGQKDGELRALLLAGFAQIDAMGLPAHAALSVTVEATRALGRPHQAGMVNALLRRAQREGFPEADVSAAWPVWLRKQIIQDWGDRSAAIFEASAHAAPMWLRVNRSKGTRDAYALRLQAADIVSTTEALLPDALRIDSPVAVSALPGFAEGDASVQDGAAQLVADALALEPGVRVLDACAAPGGKAAHLLEREPSLRLLALDVDARRLNRVRETLSRTKGAAEFRVADASDLPTWWDGEPFDAVLLDAPCSAHRHRAPTTRRAAASHARRCAGRDRAAVTPAGCPVASDQARWRVAVCHLLDPQRRKPAPDRGVPVTNRGCARRPAGCTLRPRCRCRSPTPARRTGHGWFLLCAPAQAGVARRKVGSVRFRYPQHCATLLMSGCHDHYSQDVKRRNPSLVTRLRHEQRK